MGSRPIFKKTQGVTGFNGLKITCSLHDEGGRERHLEPYVAVTASVLHIGMHEYTNVKHQN